jgi:hypothetical protein
MAANQRRGAGRGWVVALRIDTNERCVKYIIAGHATAQNTRTGCLLGWQVVQSDGPASSCTPDGITKSNEPARHSSLSAPMQRAPQLARWLTRVELHSKRLRRRSYLHVDIINVFISARNLSVRLATELRRARVSADPAAVSGRAAGAYLYTKLVQRNRETCGTCGASK